MQQATWFLSAALMLGAATSAHAGEAPDAAALQQGKEIFLAKAVPACAVCHTLADAGSSGAIGPDLDELKPSLDAVKKAIVEGVGVMPSFAATLSEDEINAVANYVVHAAGN